MLRRPAFALPAVLAVAAGLALPAPVVAQCYERSNLIGDICGSAEGVYYNSALETAAAVSLDGIPFVLFGTRNTLNIYNATNFKTPNAVGSGLRPGWAFQEGTGSYLIQHVQRPVTLDNFPYAFVPLKTYGYDWVRITPSAQFLQTGYNPGDYLRSGLYYRAGLFRDNSGKVYLVSQRADDTSANSRSDNALYIYPVYDTSKGITPETISPVSLAGSRIRVPIGTAADTPPFDSISLQSDVYAQSWPYTANGHTYLVIRANVQPNSTGAIVDVTNPIIPLPIIKLTSGSSGNQVFGHARLFEGPWAVDATHKRILVGGANGDLLSYDISDPSNPSYEGSTKWNSATSSAAGAIAAAGDLAALTGGGFTDGDYAGFASLGGADPLGLAEEQPFTYNPRACVPENAGGDQYMDVAVYSYQGSFFAARAINASGDIVKVSAACLSTVPAPSLTVVRDPSELGNPNCAATDGFPGDKFIITNTSGGQWSTAELHVTGPVGSGYSYTPVQFDATNKITWIAPTNIAGQFTFNVWLDGGAAKSETEIPATTKFATLCTNPTAGLVVLSVKPAGAGSFTQCYPNCTYLQGDTVRLSAAPPYSGGHPTGYQWFVDFASVAGTASTYDLVLTNSDYLYNVGVVVSWAFTGGTDNLGCDFSGVVPTAGLDICAQAQVDSQGYNVGALLVQQPNGTDATTLIRSQSAYAHVSYKLAANWTGNFAWSLLDGTGAAVLTSPTNAVTACPTGCIADWMIPADTQRPTGPYTVKVVPTFTDPQQNPTTLTALTKAVTVSDCTPAGAPTLTSPANNSTGAVTPVTVSWNAGTGNPAPTYTVHYGKGAIFGYQTACDNTTATSCQLTGLSDGTTYEWWVTATNTCGNADSGHYFFTTKAAVTPTPTFPPPTTPPSCTTPVISNVTINPSSPQAGQAVTFTATASGTTSSTSWQWTITLGLVNIPNPGGNPMTTTLTQPGSYQLSVKASNSSCVSQPVTRNFTVANTCTEAAAPTAAFTFLPGTPQVGTAVQFTDGSTNNPTSWSWNFGDGSGIFGAGTSTQQNPSYTFKAAGTYTVTLTATNCKGSGTQTASITVKPQCAESNPPTADFTWATVNDAAVKSKFPGQQQPYAGQMIQFTDASTNNPTEWNWSDFQGEGGPFTTQNLQFAFKTTGPKNVRHTAKNCVGNSAEVLHTVQVYSDSRPVTADFSFGDAGAAGLHAASVGIAALTTGQQIQFSAVATFDNGDPTSFTWDFGDGSASATGATVTHTYNCRGTYTVTLRASRPTVPGGSSMVTGTASKPIAIDGDLCGPEALITTGAARTEGLNGTSWRTDLRIFNPSDLNTEVWLAALPAGQTNGSPFEFGPYTVGPQATLVINDILGVFNSLPGVTQDYTKAAVRVRYSNDDDMPPVVVARTYTNGEHGGTYGQFVPGTPVLKDATPDTQWLTGLRHDGTEGGFRANIGLNNLTGEAGVGNITLTLLNAAGEVQGTKVISLAPYGYIQDTLVNLFGANVSSLGVGAVRIDAPSGSRLLAYLSDVDNTTGDPVLATARPTPTGPVTLAGLAHLAGEAGTVWRTDMEITNGSDTAHTWKLTFVPKSGIPGTFRDLPLDPGQSQLIEDVIAWLYAPLEVPDTSGVLRITSEDGDSVMPITATRTYNLSPTGTYGQSLPPLQAADGAVKGGQFATLLLTGMTSEDVARTNLGFVNLGTGGVNFEVYLYDEQGDLLNVDGAPITLYLAPGGWDQDKLENRFGNAFGTSLPANLRVVSAIVKVTNGGPGFVYASDIDPVTGDPIYIPGQLSP